MYDDMPRKCTPTSLYVLPSTMAVAGTSTSVLLKSASACSQSRFLELEEDRAQRRGIVERRGRVGLHVIRRETLPCRGRHEAAPEATRRRACLLDRTSAAWRATRARPFAPSRLRRLFLSVSNCARILRSCCIPPKPPGPGRPAGEPATAPEPVPRSAASTPLRRTRRGARRSQGVPPESASPTQRARACPPVDPRRVVHHDREFSALLERHILALKRDALHAFQPVHRLHQLRRRHRRSRSSALVRHVDCEPLSGRRDRLSRRPRR